MPATEGIGGGCGRFPQKTTGSAMRVLIVEDNKKTGGFIEKALAAEGLAVNLVGDADAAWDMLTSAPFDGMVLDIGLWT